MNKLVSAAIKWHPFAALAAYTFLIAGYRRYLDGSLKYIRPNLSVAPEDILGLGFWVPWIFAAVWFSVASYLSYRCGLQRKAGYWISLVCAFGLLSVADFYLYRVLEGQVLAG